jgi:hypothetical protein
VLGGKWAKAPLQELNDGFARRVIQSPSCTIFALAWKQEDFIAAFIH